MVEVAGADDTGHGVKFRCHQPGSRDGKVGTVRDDTFDLFGQQRGCRTTARDQYPNIGAGVGLLGQKRISIEITLTVPLRDPVWPRIGFCFTAIKNSHLRSMGIRNCTSQFSEGSALRRPAQTQLAEIPFKFPLTRELGAETASLVTASRTTP